MPSTRSAAPVLDVVVPVHDEEGDLERCVRSLEAHLRTLPFTWRITIAENGSTDDTLGIAQELAAELPGVVVRVETEPGRGRALNRAWAASDAAVLVYVDVDLSTDLDALLPLVLAERAGLRIAEVPVDWVENPDSRVHILSTAKADLAGIVRLWRAGPFLRVATVGVLIAVAYLALVALLRAAWAVATALALLLRPLLSRRRVSPDRPAAAPVPLLDLESSR